MLERVWQSVSRTKVARAVVSRPRVAMVLLLLVVLVATQGAGAAETEAATPIGGVDTDGAAVTGP